MWRVQAWGTQRGLKKQERYCDVNSQLIRTNIKQLVHHNHFVYSYTRQIERTSNQLNNWYVQIPYHKLFVFTCQPGIFELSVIAKKNEIRYQSYSCNELKKWNPFWICIWSTTSFLSRKIWRYNRMACRREELEECLWGQ